MASSSSAAQKGKVLKRADPSTIQDKFLVGYQGWFTCAGDGEPVGPGHHGWLHWFNCPIPDGGRPNTDLWPDVSSYSPSELFPAPGLKLKSGEQAFLFSSRNPRTVQRHFHWMAEHGVDGAFLQRFAGQCDLEAGNEGIRRIRDEVGDRVREAAEKEGRVFAIMYDVSGVAPDHIQGIIERDWLHLIHEKGVLDSPNYLRERGKPVIALWGFGFDNANHTPGLVRAITNYIRSVTPGGAYIMAGTPAHWRTAESDADRNPEFLDVWLNEFDAISPWTVGRYNTERDVENFAATKMKGDVDLLNKRNEEERSRKVDYIPVVLPGGSGFNLSEGKWGFNDIKRNGGRFLWKQIFNARRLGVRTIYGAMWDEYDEGTAFMPVVQSKRMLPVSDKHPFMALDEDGYDLPSDWYMRICGFAAEGLRSERRIHETFPSKELQDYWSSRPKYEDVNKTEGFVSGVSADAKAAGSGDGGGQSYEEWLATQKEDKDEPAPPPYSLEAEEPVATTPTQTESSRAPGQAVYVPPAVSASTQLSAPGQSSASTQSSTLTQSSVPASSYSSAPVQAPVVTQSSVPDQQPVPPHSSRPTPAPGLANSPSPQSTAQSHVPSVASLDVNYASQQQHSISAPRIEADLGSSHSSYQDSATSLAHDFSRHNISSPPTGGDGYVSSTSAYSVSSASPLNVEQSYDLNLLSHSHPQPQYHPPGLGSQPGHTPAGSPSLPAEPHSPGPLSQGQWPPPEWKVNKPSQHPQGHFSGTQGPSNLKAGANLSGPNSLSASSRPPAGAALRPHASIGPSSIRPQHQSPPSPPDNFPEFSQFPRPASHSPPFPSSPYSTGGAPQFPVATGPFGVPSFPSGPAASHYPPPLASYSGQAGSSYPAQDSSTYNASTYQNQYWAGSPSHNSPPHSPVASSYAGQASYIAQGSAMSNNPAQGINYSGPPCPNGPSSFSHSPLATLHQASPYANGPQFPQGPGGEGEYFNSMPQYPQQPPVQYQASNYPSPHDGISPYSSSSYLQSSATPNPNSDPRMYGAPHQRVLSAFPPRPPIHPLYSHSSASSYGIVPAAPGGALSLARSAVEKVAGRKTREQLESHVGSLAQSSSKLFGKLTKQN